MKRELKKIYSYRLNPLWDRDKKNNLKYLIDDVNDHYIDLLWEYLERDWKGEDITKIKKTSIKSACWEEVARDLVFYFNLTEDFLYEYRDSLNWNCICTWQDLSEKFIWYMRKYINWETILENQKLSEKFIRENSARFKHEHWYSLSLNQKIKFSEEFMREYRDLLEWTSLCDKQHFTLDFIRENMDKICVNHINWTLRQMINEDKNSNEFRHAKEICSGNTATRVAAKGMMLKDIK